MEKCKNCKIKYPDGYLSQFMTSEGSILVCGICALEIVNKVFEIDRKKFKGEHAEKLRQRAIKFRKGLARVLENTLIVKK